jgi:hypothetical protein
LPIADADFRQTWQRYYTDKRIVHQWFQVHLVNTLGVQRVLEIGPYMGLVTAMLANARYDVTTLDVDPGGPRNGATGHIQVDLRDLRADQIMGFDCILCCETLEHLHWDKVDGILEVFAASGAPWLVLSVPYEATQVGFSLYWNRYVFRKRSFLKKLRWLDRFVITDDADFDAHKWEVGYKGYSLDALKAKVAAAGWAVERQDFTEGCRSVFLVCRNTSV